MQRRQKRIFTNIQRSLEGGYWDYTVTPSKSIPLTTEHLVQDVEDYTRIETVELGLVLRIIIMLLLVEVYIRVLYDKKLLL